MPIKTHFPPSGADYMGGVSDGWKYETSFVGASLQAVYDMVLAFLKEEGFGDLPYPKDAAELLKFKTPTRNRQLLLYADNGYVHNPIKILFPTQKSIKHKLVLQIYNPDYPEHLLKFHGKDI